jgi:hypothetical protein
MLKFIGRDFVKVYSKADFLRQKPNAPQWNDSAWLNWWDSKNKVGGVHRLGHEYNRPDGGPPMVAAWSNLITPKGVYRRVKYLPLREADKLPNGWGSGDDTSRVEFDEDGSVWTINDPEYGVSAKLRNRDFHDPFCGFPSAGKTHDEITSDHIDVAGSITGTITMQGETFRADGMGSRDHGWGHRNLYTMRSHRYISGTFGPDFSFAAWAIHSVHDSVEAFGWVMKGDTAIFPKDIDIVVYAEIDSCSTRGGRIRYVLPDGEVIEAELIAEAPGMLHYFHNLANNNTSCVAHCNGRVGGGMVETSMNYHEGHRAPTKLQRAIAASGFFPALPVERWNGPDTPFLPKRTVD